MPRIKSLNILLTTEGKDYLSELYGKVIAGVMKALVSVGMKNTDLSGDPEAGSVEAKRFVNAKPQRLGTARAAGAGNLVKAKPVTVAISEDMEIVEEMAEKDTRLYGVDGLLDMRAQNHVIRMAADLDTDFFNVAYNNAIAVEINAAADITDELEAVIQECENTQNDFVDGVPRELMYLVLNTTYYGKIRNKLDEQSRANVDTGEEKFYTWHGVECESSVHLPTGCRYILMVKGAVAQPVMASQYQPEKIPLSEDYAVSLFYHYGTKCVMPDLIFTGVLAGLGDLMIEADIPGTTDLLGKYVGDLQSGVEIEDGEIRAVLNYIDDYTGYSGLPAEQAGNFLALHTTCAGADSITVELVGGTTGAKALDSDGISITRVTDPDKQVLRFVATKGTDTLTRYFDLRGLICKTE